MVMMLLLLIDVATLSKIKISKAIHNMSPGYITMTLDVATLSKIKISKAIHNLVLMTIITVMMLPLCQR